MRRRTGTQLSTFTVLTTPSLSQCRQSSLPKTALSSIAHLRSGNTENTSWTTKSRSMLFSTWRSIPKPRLYSSKNCLVKEAKNLLVGFAQLELAGGGLASPLHSSRPGVHLWGFVHPHSQVHEKYTLLVGFVLTIGGTSAFNSACPC